MAEQQPPSPVPLVEPGTQSELTAEPGTGAEGTAGGTPARPPEFVALTPDQVPATGEPGCLAGQGRYARYVLEAYVSTYVNTCWVAWIGDAGSSIVFNEGATWDKVKIYVKQASDVVATNWTPLGDGVGPVGPDAGMNSFSLVIDPAGQVPMVAWAMEESIHWNGSSLFVARWDGKGWQSTTADGDTRLNAVPRPPQFGGSSTVDSPRLTLDEAQRVVLSWKERAQFDAPEVTYRRTWDGAAWSPPVAAP